jgi:hypothetical protein
MNWLSALLAPNLVGIGHGPTAQWLGCLMSGEKTEARAEGIVVGQ